MRPQPISKSLPRIQAALLLHEGGPTEGQLLGEFIRAGDDAAFASLVKRHAAMVFGVCQRLIGDVHIAEDAFSGGLSGPCPTGGEHSST